ncbi:MAG: helix-turn-helix transcriptional regulator [Chloroflexi bacterium]|nr:helix-turn-helix transcriptional regulator [Chloroflexota bacterium]
MIERELLKGSTDSLLMALLAERPMYGYQLLRELERRSGGYFHLKEGTLYPALHRLEREGLIEGLWRTAPGGQYRRYYAISVRGLREYEQRVSEWQSFARAINLVMAASPARA